MKPPYLLALVFAAVFGACVEHQPPVTGTWTAHTTLDSKDCPRCEAWVGLDLFENQHGVVTGTLATVSTSSFDMATDASYVMGTRTADSIKLVGLFPCDSGSARVDVRFRGHITSGTDTIRGVFRYKLLADSVRGTFALTRGRIDSAMTRGISWLVKTCRAAA